MPPAIKAYVRYVEAFNRGAGRISMYLIFVMMGILLWSSFSKTFLLPSLWTLEMAQFTLTAYYLLGGAYSLQLGSNVRMDLIYGGWTDRQKAWVDAFSVFALIFYLGVLLYGGISSTDYALEYGERSYSSWRPYMAPIKIIMCIGIILMLLQAVAEFFKDIAKIRGEEF
ncbi:MAG TPA: TRAP transporter small permease subunit [Hyphomicrobiales bacterium]|nr:TRAP transporter small permease subunit [Hyphomicrobiales bacterium]